jgi:hypothetical protein
VAEIHGVKTRAPNRAVKRNQDRFPDDFLFELTRAGILRTSKTVTSLPELESPNRCKDLLEAMKERDWLVRISNTIYYLRGQKKTLPGKSG